MLWASISLFAPYHGGKPWVSLGCLWRFDEVGKWRSATSQVDSRPNTLLLEIEVEQLISVSSQQAWGKGCHGCPVQDPPAIIPEACTELKTGECKIGNEGEKYNTQSFALYHTCLCWLQGHLMKPWLGRSLTPASALLQCEAQCRAHCTTGSCTWFLYNGS